MLRGGGMARGGEDELSESDDCGVFKLRSLEELLDASFLMSKLVGEKRESAVSEDGE